jgi:signal peptidase
MSRKLKNALGITLIVLVIAVVLPLSLPRLAGYEIYNIVSGSMTPVYPIDSVIFVAPTDVSDLKEGDVITFSQGSGAQDVVTHRIVSIDETAREMITRGDANNTVDPQPVRFDNVIGRVAFSIS